MSKHSVRKKLFLNYHFEFFYQLVASERKTFISIYYTSQSKISISLKDMFSAMHLGGQFILKSAKTSKKDCKSTKTKLSKFVPQSFRIWLKAYHGELVDKKKIPATIMRLAPIFQVLAPTCLMIHKFGCNECTKKTLSEITYLTLNLILR